jgi:hypothetical protein
MRDQKIKSSLYHREGKRQSEQGKRPKEISRVRNARSTFTPCGSHSYFVFILSLPFYMFFFFFWSFLYRQKRQITRIIYQSLLQPNFEGSDKSEKLTNKNREVGEPRNCENKTPSAVAHVFSGFNVR